MAIVLPALLCGAIAFADEAPPTPPNAPPNAPPNSPPAEPPAAPSCEWLSAHWLCNEKSTKAERHLLVQTLDETSIRIAIYDGDDVPDENSDDWETHKYSPGFTKIRPLVSEKMICGEDSSLTIARKLSFAATATFVYKKSPNQDDLMTFSHTVTAVGEQGFTELTSCRKLP